MLLDDVDNFVISVTMWYIPTSGEVCVLNMKGGFSKAILQ